LFQSFEEEREGIFERSIRDSFLFLYWAANPLLDDFFLFHVSITEPKR
jgi:hypothetical protein